MLTSIGRRCGVAVAAMVCGVVLALPAQAFDLQYSFLRDDLTDPVPAGGTIIYEVELLNGDSDTANDVRSIYDVPAGTTPTNLPAFCSVAGSRIECVHGNLLGTQPPANGAAVAFQLQFVSTVPGVVTLRGAIGTGVPPITVLPLAVGDAFFSGDTDPANNAAEQITTVTNGANLAISKTDSPDPVVGGAEVTYTISVDNLGPSDSTGVRVVDNLPAATSFVAGSASGAGWSFSVSGQTLTATRAAVLSNGGSAQFSFRAKVNAGSGTITNAATVDTTGAGATPDPVPGNNTASVDTAVNPGADLAVTKTATPSPAVAGDTVTFTLLPRNLGPSTAINAVLLDTLPAGFTLVSVLSSPNWLCPGNPGDTSLTCTRASFPVGASDNIQFVAQIPAAASGSVTNTATISADTAEPVPGNNSGSVNLTVLPRGADLVLQSKGKSPAIVPVWDGVSPDTASRMVSDIVVRNDGPLAVSANLQVTDTLAAGEQFISASGPWTCVATGTPPTQSVTCTFNGPYPVNVGQTLNGGNRLFITTLAITAGTLTNTACTGGSGGSSEPDTSDGTNVDPTPGNDCTGATTRATNESGDLTISKATSTPLGGDKVVTTAENSVSYTLVVGNAGSNAMGGIVVDDAIPGFIAGRTPAPTVVAPAGFTCTPAATVRCTSNAGFQLAPGDTRTITITVARPLNDTSLSGSITCNGASVSNAFCNSADVRVDGASPDAVGESDTSNNIAQDFVQIDRVANVQTTSKTILSGTPGRAGVDTQYRIEYRNQGPSAVPGVVFDDTFTIPANDPGFVVRSATRTPGTLACTVTPGVGITTTVTAGGTSYSNAGNGAPGTIGISCPALNLANNQVEAMLLTIRPNFASGGATRQFDNIGSFSISGGASGSDALGSFEFNTIATPADDEKAAMLPFEAGQVDLITNKTDLVDPIGFDPSDFTQNAITYRLRVTNNGPSLATALHVTDVIAPPAGRTVRFIGDSTSSTGPFAPSACSISAGSNPVIGPATLSLDCMMPGVGFSPNIAGSVAAGSTTELFLRVQYESQPAAGGDTLVDTATAIANEADTNPANDSDGENTSIRARADLALSKIASNVLPDADPNVAAPAPVASVTLFEPHWWVLDAINNGPGASLSIDRAAASQLNGSGTVIVDTLPTGTVLSGSATWQKSGPAFAGSTPDGSGNCALAGVTLSCNVGDVSPGGKVRIIVPVRWTTFPAGGSVTNNAVVSTEQVDPIPGNNNASAVLAVTRSSLTGIVFQDRDRSAGNGGIPQAAASEPRINAVTVRITGTDLYGNAVNRTTTSNATGVYTLSNLAPSDASGYTLTQTQPAGFANGPIDPPIAGASAPTLGGSYSASINAGGDSQYSAISVGGNVAGANYNFPELRRPSVSGFVYIDVNGSGVREAGTDLAIAGASVRLLDASNGNLINTVSTDASGGYSFTGLDPLIAYTLEQPLPASPTGIINGPINPGLINALACVSGCTAQADTPAADSDRIADIDLSAGTDGTVFNFGEIQLADIAGLVYVDADRNNALDAADTTRIANVVVRLVQGADCATGTELANTFTDALGAFAFADQLAFRDYLLCQTQPLGYGNGNANGTPGSDQIAISNLPAAGSLNNGFGELVGALAGSVYIDQNDNGARDAGELGIDNVPVTLTGTDVLGNVLNQVVNTDLNGDYRFINLFTPNASGYRLSEGSIPPAAGVFNDGQDALGNAIVPGTLGNDVLSAIGLGAGQQAGGYLFGELQATAISGVVYVDADRNNALDASDPLRIAGVSVRLLEGNSCATGVQIDSATTNAAGAYQFFSITVGRSYAICQTQPAGYGNGNALGVPGSDEILIASLPLAGVAGNNFGELVGSIAGSVYVDANDNGLRDTTEAGIANVPVVLSGSDARGNAVNLSVSSDASGNYGFANLLAPNAAGYTLSEGAIPPAAGSFNDGRDALGNAAIPGTLGNDVLSGIGLAPAQDASGYLFGELQSSTISGVVYVDADRNNALDASDSVRIAGVIVRLVQGATCATGTQVASTSTDAAGAYVFTSVTALRDYLICQTQPTGYGNGNANGTPGVDQITISNLPLAGSADNNFGELLGSISGRVFLDSNNNGSQDAGEPGIAGVQVALSGADVNGLAVAANRSTDGNGDFRFDSLLQANGAGYALTEQLAQPVVDIGGVSVATANGITRAGQVGGSSLGNATAVTQVPSAVQAIVLPGGADSLQNLFAEVLPVGITGSVFLDLDNNGVRNAPADGGIAAVRIELSGIDDIGQTVTLSVDSDADGRFAFEGLRPGNYTLTEPTQPLNTLNGITTAGSAGGNASAVAVLPSVIAAIDLSLPGTRSDDNRFAEVPASGVIAGRVWLDRNNDGVIDASELGIADVLIELSGSDLGGNAISRSQPTDAEGRFRFADLPPGQYTLREPNQPADTFNGITVPGTGGGNASAPDVVPSVIAAIELPANGEAVDNHFGEIPPASIAGRVWADNDNDGVIDADESGISGVTVVLSGVDDLGVTVNESLASDGEGRYVFDGLRPGTYSVSEPQQPAGTLNGITVAGQIAGTVIGTVTPVDVVPSSVSLIVIAPGDASLDNNFGEIPESPDLKVSKRHEPARFSVNNPGRYVISVRNAGNRASTGEYQVSDRLPAGIVLAATPAGTGWLCDGAIGDSTFSCRSTRVLAAGESSPDVIAASVSVGAAALAASPANNAVLVEGGGEIDARRPTPNERDAFSGDPAQLPVCDPAIIHEVCRDPVIVQQAAALSGSVWYDLGSNPLLLDGGDQRLQGWIVEVFDLSTGQVIASTLTGPDGRYRIVDLPSGQVLQVRFRDPDSSVVWGVPVNGETVPGSPANCDSDGAIAGGFESSCSEGGSMGGASTTLAVVLAPGDELIEQSLPIIPGGVVYDAIARTPVAGATVTLIPIGTCPGYDPAQDILNAAIGGYRIEGDAISMTVGDLGLYRFLFAPDAPASCTFRIEVTPPPGFSFVSQLIAPQPGALDPGGSAGGRFDQQPQATPPLAPVGPGTAYALQIVVGGGKAAIVNNHIPLDPSLPTGLAISKVADRQIAEVGDTVLYTVLVRHTGGSALPQVSVLDRLPAGFTYLANSAVVNGRNIADPAGAPGPALAFDLGPIGSGGQLTLNYRLRVGVGSQQGDGVNRAQAFGCGLPAGCIDPITLTPFAGTLSSNEARFRLRVSGGVFTNEACVLGKIYVDCNTNQMQDGEELGIPGVRLYFEDGTWLISDSEGKYSYCGLTPQSHVLKADNSTLPQGSRLVTSSNRNLGDAGSLFLDLKNGELHRADFIEGSCSNPVIEQVKARRTQGEVSVPETESKQAPLRFESKPARAPRQATDSAKQAPIVAPRAAPPTAQGDGQGGGQ
ncbi:MAG: SdrD B-like domain-containing protein [Xanthomonadaceae bacterium]|nr:SdrD B-like domain-containing protein [Xanthomonadaceae bacterium]